MYEKKIGNSSAEAIGRIPQTKNDIFPDRNLVDREVGVVAAMKMKTSVTNQWVAKQLSLVNVLKISCMANVSIKESDPEFIEKLNATTNHKPRPLFSLMDAENRLIVMETHPAVAEKRRLEFAYDSQGRRIRKEVQEWEPGSGQFVPAKSLRFFYDGWNLIEERDLLNGDAVKRRHVWGLDVTGTPQGAGGVGGLLWSETATHTFAASADANSNIIAWVETATLSVSGRADYGAFGEPVMRTGAAREMPFGFSTKYTDFETDLLYYGYRYYSPSMGRFLNRDPIEEEGGLNLYAFVGNDPMNRWDYLGLEAFTFTVMTFIPQDYVQYPIGALYRGDGGRFNRSIGRRNYRTRQEVGFDPDQPAIVSEQNDVGVSVRYRRPNPFEKSFVDYESKPGVWYNQQYWIEDARDRADASRVKATFSEIDVCKVRLRLTAHIGDPIGPPGTPKVDYTMEVEFYKHVLSEPWRLRARADHDGFPSYLFFYGANEIWFHDGWTGNPLQLFPNIGDIS